MAAFVIFPFHVPLIPDLNLKKPPRIDDDFWSQHKETPIIKIKLARSKVGLYSL